MLILDKSLGIVHEIVMPAASSSVAIPRTESLSDRDTSTVGNISSDNSTTTLSSVKPAKMTPNDKDKIKMVYYELDPNEMWALSTGTVVEKRVQEFFLTCSYEQ